MVLILFFYHISPLDLTIARGYPLFQACYFLRGRIVYCPALSISLPLEPHKLLCSSFVFSHCNLQAITLMHSCYQIRIWLNKCRT